MHYSNVFSILILASLWSCGPHDPEIDTQDLVWKPAALTKGGTWSGVTFTAEEATAVLDMANTATLSQLDHEIALMSTAAKNIISQRSIRTMEALDDVPYIGKTALQRLKDYVPYWNLTPEEGSTITQSGVTFTMAETEAALQIINSATSSLLDGVIGLDVRAVQSILAARPISSLAALDALPYVGGNALQKIKNHIPYWVSPTPQAGGTYNGVTFTAAEETTALDIANLASVDQLTQGGLAAGPKNIIIANRPWDSLSALASFNGIGPATVLSLREMIVGWTNAPQPAQLTVKVLMQETKFHGTTSPYYNQVVKVERAIVTSVPLPINGGLTFWIADPDSGNLQGFLASISFPKISFITIFDELQLKGRFSRQDATFQLRLDDLARHTVALNHTGLNYGDYQAIQAAWHSTAQNPEGVVRVVSSAGYIFMVPLPLFLDHPMWLGDPPSPPKDSGNVQDLGWNAMAQQTLNDWRASQ